MAVKGNKSKWEGKVSEKVPPRHIQKWVNNNLMFLFVQLKISSLWSCVWIFSMRERKFTFYWSLSNVIAVHKKYFVCLSRHPLEEFSSCPLCAHTCMHTDITCKHPLIVAFHLLKNYLFCSILCLHGMWMILFLSGFKNCLLGDSKNA